MRKSSALPVAALVLGLAGPGLAMADARQQTSSQPAWKEKREQRQAVNADVEEWRQAWRALSPTDRSTLAEAWIAVADYVQGLTPAQKERIREAAQTAAERLRNMTPEQRAQLKQRLEKASAAYAALTPEQKEAILSHMAATIDRLGSLTPAQKESLKALYRRLLALRP
jgi:truncated hemoglobin YjbI